jgi:hypothetical protein
MLRQEGMYHPALPSTEDTKLSTSILFHGLITNVLVSSSLGCVFIIASEQ